MCYSPWVDISHMEQKTSSYFNHTLHCCILGRSRKAPHLDAANLVFGIMCKAWVAERLTDAATTMQQVAVQKNGKVPATADAQRIQRSELEKIVAWPCASLPAPRHGMWLRKCGISAK